MKPKYTIICNLSRPWMEYKIKEYIASIPVKEHERQIIYNYDKSPASSAPSRVPRIVNMMRWYQDKIQGEYVFCLEDDTIPERSDAMLKLIETLKTQENAGYVTGAEANRWSFRNIGAWIIQKANSLKGISEMTSIPYKESGVEEISGGGWFCFVTTKKIFQQNSFELNPNDEVGPDVWWSAKIIMLFGKKNYINWDVKCNHYTNKDKFISADEGKDILYYNIKKISRWKKL